MKQFNPFQFLAWPSGCCWQCHCVLLRSSCHHVTVSVSWVMSAFSTVFSPTLPCHCILSPALNLAQCPTDILQGMGNTLIRSVRPITSGFEENLKCPISSFNVLSLCFVPTQWGKGEPIFTHCRRIYAEVRFTSHSLDPQQMFCDVMNRN